MKTIKVDLPDDVLGVLKQSVYGDRPVEDQLRIALAIQLMQERLITVGKAASIAGEPRVVFEGRLREIPIPTLRYDLDDVQHDLESLRKLDEARTKSR